MDANIDISEEEFQRVEGEKILVSLDENEEVMAGKELIPIYRAMNQGDEKQAGRIFDADLPLSNPKRTILTRRRNICSRNLVCYLLSSSQICSNSLRQVESAATC